MLVASDNRPHVTRGSYTWSDISLWLEEELQFLEERGERYKLGRCTAKGGYKGLPRAAPWLQTMRGQEDLDKAETQLSDWYSDGKVDLSMELAFVITRELAALASRIIPSTPVVPSSS